MNLPSPPDLDKVADILADLSPKPPDDLVEVVKGHLHRKRPVFPPYLKAPISAKVFA